MSFVRREEALGHSYIAFTMEVYSHIIEGMQSDAMALLDEVLPAGKNGVKNKINARTKHKCICTFRFSLMPL